jgi:outer membrane receptor protein involved in Fe transport
MNRTLRLHHLVPALALATGALPAMEAPPTADGGTIVVTGEQIDRDRQDTITSASVVTGDDLDAMPGSPDLNAVLRRQANVAVADGQVVIRGINAYEGENPTPLISTTVDGAWVSPDQNRRGWSPMQLWDIEQIEVLRGPQSTERGPNSVGGAVVIRTADPTFHHTGRARALYGSYDTVQVAAAQGGPLVDDILAYRLAADYLGSSGYLEDAAGRDDYGEHRAIDVRGKLLWRPRGDERLWVKLTVDHVAAESNNQNVNGWTAEPEERRPDPFLEGFPNIGIESSTTSAVLDAAWRVADHLTVANTLAWNGYETTADFDAIGSPDDFAYDDRALTNELTATSTSDRLTAVGGLYVGRYRDGFAGIQANGILDVDQTTTRSTLAAFASADWRCAEQWTLTGGLRLEHERMESAFSSTVAGTPSAGSDAADALVALPRVGARWDATAEVTLGAQVSRGYRGGGVSYDYVSFNGFQAYDPEFVWNYEASLRTQLADRQVTANVNLFYLDWQDKQIAVFQGAGLPDATENAGAAHSYGAEAELAARPRAVPGLTAGVSFGLLRTEYDDYDDGNGADFSGRRFPLAPERTLSAFAHYRHDSGAFGGIEAIHQGEAFDGIDNDPDETVYDDTTLNARVGYAWRLVEASLFANNLTDSFAYLRRPNAFYVVPNEPRVIGVQLEARW